METERPYCLSIAGFDPCGGAGVLADIKTFEQLLVQGLGVSSALTFQNDETFEGVQWIPFSDIQKQLEPLKKYPVKVAKIGLIESLEILDQLVDLLNQLFPKIKIIWDPVIKASAGYAFHTDSKVGKTLAKKITLITPNQMEYDQLQLHQQRNCAVLLKGGHRENVKGLDTLFLSEKQIDFIGELLDSSAAKHGSGCVLSSAIAANLALGESLPKACRKAKEYVEDFLVSNQTNLGYHSK